LTTSYEHESRTITNHWEVADPGVFDSSCILVYMNIEIFK